LGAVFLTILLDLVGFGMFIPIIANVARELGASTTHAAALSTWFSVGTLVSVVTLGRLSDRIGRKPVLVGTVALSTLAQLATGFVGTLAPAGQTILALTAVRFVAGIAAGNIGVAQACIADLTSPRERSRYMILIGLAFGAGFAIGPALGAAVATFWEHDTLRAVAFAGAALNVVNLAAVAWRMPESKGLRQRLLDAEAALEPHSAAQFSRSPLEPAPSSWRTDLAALLRTPGFAVVLLLQFLQVFSFVGVETILPIALRDAYALADASIYQAFIVIGVSVLVVNGGLARPVLKRIGEVPTLILGQLFLAVGVASIPLFAPRVPLLYAGLVLLALGTGLSNPALSSIVSRLAPASQQGLALSTAQGLSAGARIAGPVTLGLLYESMNGARSLVVSFTLLLVGALTAVVGLAGARAQFRREENAPEAST
jgi:MFS family permease